MRPERATLAEAMSRRFGDVRGIAIVASLLDAGVVVETAEAVQRNGSPVEVGLTRALGLLCRLASRPTDTLILASVRVEGVRGYLHPPTDQVTVAALAERYRCVAALTQAVVREIVESAGVGRDATFFATLSRSVIVAHQRDAAPVIRAVQRLDEEIRGIWPDLSLQLVTQEVPLVTLLSAGAGNALVAVNVAASRKDGALFAPWSRPRASAPGNDVPPSATGGRRAVHRLAPLLREWMDVPVRPHVGARESLASLARSAAEPIAWFRLDARQFVHRLVETSGPGLPAITGRSAQLASFFSSDVPAELSARASSSPHDGLVLLHSMSDDIVYVGNRRIGECVAARLVDAFDRLGGHLRVGVAPLLPLVRADELSRSAHASLRAVPAAAVLPDESAPRRLEMGS